MPLSTHAQHSTNSTEGFQFVQLLPSLCVNDSMRFLIRMRDTRHPTNSICPRSAVAPWTPPIKTGIIPANLPALNSLSYCSILFFIIFPHLTFVKAFRLWLRFTESHGLASSPGV